MKVPCAAQGNSKAQTMSDLCQRLRPARTAYDLSLVGRGGVGFRLGEMSIIGTVAPQESVSRLVAA